MSSLVILMLLVQAPSAAPTPYSHYNQFTKYDRHFSKYSKRYFGAGFDWRYFKAQAIAESGLQADARSRVGAIGIMQVMPRTFEDIRQQNPQIEGGWINRAGTLPRASGTTGGTSSSGGHRDRSRTNSSLCSRLTTPAAGTCCEPNGSRSLTDSMEGYGRRSRIGFPR